jgi:hypothetical protein
MSGFHAAGEFTCPACGVTFSRLPADHETVNETDAHGRPIIVCNYGSMVNTYRLECWGGGGPPEPHG